MPIAVRPNRVAFFGLEVDVVADEKLLEKIRGLAPDEIDEVEHFIDSLRSQRSCRPIPATTLADLANAERSMLWVAEHRHEYGGQWVALDGDRLVAAGQSAKEVADQARREGVRAPFLDRVDPDPARGVWGGWV